MNYYLTCDIGGTDIKYGVININNEFQIKGSTPTKSHLSGKAIMNQISDIFLSYNDTYNLKGIALSSAGVINTKTNTIVDGADTIKDYIGTNINDELKHLNVPISVENDVNSAAICEMSVGSGKDYMDAVMITIGTGIGGAIFINGEIYRGGAFSAGEWGNMIIEHGQKFENIAATKILVENARKIYPEIKNGIDVFNLYDQGNESIINIVNDFYNNLAIGISNIVYSLNPKLVIIGGGITGRGDKLLFEMRPFIKQKLSEYMYNNTNFKIAKYKNDAGMIGAFENFKLLYNI